MRQARLGSALVVLLIAISGCQSTGPGTPHASKDRVHKDSGPAEPPPHLHQLPDPVPKIEPRSKYGNPAQYTVNGHTYQVMDTASGYVQTGLASWYGRKFHGRRTSSGEPFDMYALTAAHKHLPLPTYVRVTNLGNGKSTIVRVNDRGPFHPERIIDLSYAAAVKLGFQNHGTARVRVEALTRERRYALQAGAFSTLAAADALRSALSEVTEHPAHVVSSNEDNLYRVRVGPIDGEAAARQIQGRIEAANLGRTFLVEM